MCVVFSENGSRSLSVRIVVDVLEPTHQYSSSMIIYLHIKTFIKFYSLSEALICY